MLLEVLKISKTFQRGITGKPVRVLHEVSFFIKKGEAYGIMGNSGSGKTTLARIIAGLLQPDSGRIVINGQDVLQVKNAFLRKVQVIFQHPNLSLDPRQRIFEAISEPLFYHKIVTSRKQAMKKVSELFDMVNLHEEILGRYPAQISGGQAQRVVIARALSLNPELIIADEPTSMLDVSVQAQIISLLKDLKEQKGVSILFISHDLPLVNAFCDNFVRLSDGMITEQIDLKGWY